MLYLFRLEISKTLLFQYLVVFTCISTTIIMYLHNLILPLSAFTLSISTVGAQKTIPSLSGPAVDFTGSNAASAYPRANYLSNGNLIGAYTAFPDGVNQVLTLVTSTDSGATWTKTGTAASKPIADGTLDNPFPFQLPSGRVLLAFRTHTIDSAGNFLFYRIDISYSDDLGANWKFLSEPVVITANPNFKNGVWEPFIRLGADGTTLQLYYSRELGDIDQNNFVITSTDGGVSWSAETTVSGGVEVTRDGMVGVAELTEGNGQNLIAVFESNTNGGPFSVYSVTSSDGGANWGNRRPVYQPAAGKNAGAPQVINVGGTLVASFMTDEDVTAQDWPTNAAGKLKVSTDGGASWTNKFQVFAPQSQWPGLLRLNGQDAFLYLISNNGVVRAQKVVLS